MSEAALCTVWGIPVPGREKDALDNYGDALQYLGRLQQEGKIEGFEVVVLGPTGGDLTGFMLVRGTQAQLDAARHEDEYERLLIRQQLVAQHVRTTDAYVDEGLARIMGQYTDAVGKL